LNLEPPFLVAPSTPEAALNALEGEGFVLSIIVLWSWPLQQQSRRYDTGDLCGVFAMALSTRNAPYW
jgi:hypothetical protein